MKLLSLLSCFAKGYYMNEVHSYRVKNNQLFCFYEGGFHFVADSSLLLVILLLVFNG